IGSSASPLIPFAIWLFAATLLSLGLTVAWTDRTTEYIWRVPLAFVAMTIPPLGIIGFISPLTAAGFLFPSTSWAGLAAVTLLPGVLLAARGSVPRVRSLRLTCDKRSREDSSRSHDTSRMGRREYALRRRVSTFSRL